MESNRLQKVGRLIQKDLGDILRLEARNLFNGAIISVTKVSVSADISLARVYISIFVVGKQTKEDIMTLITHNKKTLRSLLSQRIRHQLRIIPDLAFFLDDSLDYAANIDRLLKE
ncbi:MAG: 30S ribosome-binding factor RbfA [Bacteroidales bacterium]|jgi:ribosome-binding factor A|nr:30S ribosome-binding factor RbfA [Bacteroidales bacterium]